MQGPAPLDIESHIPNCQQAAHRERCVDHKSTWWQKIRREHERQHVTAGGARDGHTRIIANLYGAREGVENGADSDPTVKCTSVESVEEKDSSPNVHRDSK